MNVKGILIFFTGLVAGAGSMYLALNKYYSGKTEKIINEELSKLDGNRNPEPKNDTPEVTEESKEPDLSVYKEVLKKVDYTKASTVDKVTTMTDAIEEEVKELKETVKKTKKPKVPKKVTQDEFDATHEDEKATLYFYADGVLADDEDNVYDPVETMGATNLKNFKSNYDTVYIFNYANNLMYEIIPSNSKYSDFIGGDIGR